jgi:hypothetical protein
MAGLRTGSVHANGITFHYLELGTGLVGVVFARFS